MNNENKLNGFYRGQVLLHLTHGYCRIYIPGVYPETFKKKKELIPPAELAASLFGGANNGSGEFTYPNIDSIVWCFFANGDLNFPVYFASSLGGENAFGQYQIIKTTDEEESTRHLLTSGKTLIELFENGKVQCVVSNPDRRPAKVNYASKDDIQKLNEDQVSEYTNAQKVAKDEVENVNCQVVLDNDLSTNGMAQLKTHHYDLLTDTTKNNNYTLSSTNNLTMTNDGEVVLDSVSCYHSLSAENNNTELEDVVVQNDLDMELSNGISLYNTKQYLHDIKASNNETQTYVDMNMLTLNQCDTHFGYEHLSTYEKSSNNCTESDIAKISQEKYGNVGMLSKYDYEKTKDGDKTELHIAKGIGLISDLDAETSNLCSEISYVKNCSGSKITEFQGTITEDNAIDAKLNVMTSSKIFSNTFSDLTANINRDTNVNRIVASDGTITDSMTYSLKVSGDKLDSLSQITISKDKGFSESTSIDASTNDFSILSSASRTTTASIKGASLNEDSVNVDGLAFDMLHLNAQVGGGGIAGLDGGVDCDILSIHDTEKATIIEKVSNSVSGKKCEASIIVDATNGTIKLNISDPTTNDNSHLVLNKNGIVRINSSKAILLESQLIHINGKILTDVFSQNHVVLSANYVSTKSEKGAQIRAPNGAVKILTINGMNKMF